MNKSRNSATLADLPPRCPPFERGGDRWRAAERMIIPHPEPSRAWQGFSPPFNGGAGGGELTISINLTLIDALFLRAIRNGLVSGARSK